MLSATLLAFLAACGSSSGDAGPDAGIGDQPDASDPGSGTPDAGDPGSGTPDAGDPGSGTPDAGDPDAEPAPAPAEIEIVRVVFEPEEATAGEPTTITAVVQNRGELVGEKTLELAIDDTLEDSKTVSVEPPGDGETPEDTEVEFEFTPSTGGLFAIAVNDFDAGTLTSIAGFSGVVTSLGLCGVNPEPAAGAALSIDGEHDTYDTVTDAEGEFSIDLPEAEVEVTVTLEDHQTLVAPAVAVNDAASFELTIELPCATVSPNRISETLPADQDTTATLSIGNEQGGAEFEWQFEGTPLIRTTDPRAHFPSSPYVAPRTAATESVSAGADPGVAPGGLRMSSSPLSAEVPAFSTTGFNILGYVGLDALEPDELTIINEEQPDISFAGAFIGRDFTQHVMLLSQAGQDQLVAVDTTTGDVEELGEVVGSPSEIWTSLAWDYSTDTLFASTATELYTLDLETRQLTLVGAYSGEELNEDPIIISIAISEEGLMFAIELRDNVFIAIDKTDAAASVFGPLGVDPNFAQDMDFDHSDGTLYWAGYQGGGNSQMFTIDLETGTATSLGNVDGGPQLMSFTIANAPPLDCVLPESIPWLSASDDAGTVEGGSTQAVELTLDASQTIPGNHSAELCVRTTDPEHEFFVVPVDLVVEFDEI